MIPIPEDFHLRARAMMQDGILIEQQFKILKSFENPAWSKTWFDISEQFRSMSIDSLNPLIQIRKQCAALAIACYPCLEDPQRIRYYQLLKDSYIRLCKLEGYPVEYHNYCHKKQSIPYTIRKTSSDSPPKGTILMIRGLDSFKEVRYWDENPILDKGYNIIGIDFPGMGENPCQMTNTSENLFSDLIDHLIKSKRSDSPIICWGLGFGGYWAQKLALTYPDKVQAAINQGGPIHYGFKPNLKKLVLNYSEIRFLSNMIQIALHKKISTRSFIAQLSLLKQNLLPNLRVPLMYLNGDQDKTASNKEFRLLKSKLNKELYTGECIPGSGHLAIDALDDIVIPRIMDWIHSLESQSQYYRAS